jgi:hypothetical protein
MYNRFCQYHNSSKNAYIACASTGKAAVSLGGTTVHSTFRISLSRKHGVMSMEAFQGYRSAFHKVHIMFIDEVSMVSSDILQTVHVRLQEITTEFQKPFGWMNIVFCGDLRQLPPVNAQPVFKPHRDSLSGAAQWQSLHYFPLKRVMRQSDMVFSSILTKIGNGNMLTLDEKTLLESRFKSREQSMIHAPYAICLFHRNYDIVGYNNMVFDTPNAITCVASDTLCAYRTNEQMVSMRTKLHKMSVAETGGLPYVLKLLLDKPYMITSNIDIDDRLVNGAVVMLIYIEWDDDATDNELRLKRVWLHLQLNAVGKAAMIKACPYVFANPGIVCSEWKPMMRKTATITFKNRQPKCKRLQFPRVEACAMTVHKSQGRMFDKVVFNYERGLDQQLVYMGLSRVTSIHGLDLKNHNSDYMFHHQKGSSTPKIKDLHTE